MKAKPKIWTEKEVADLKKYWGRGYSAASIAKHIGKTRNAIIGKAHRMRFKRKEFRNTSDVIVPNEDPRPTETEVKEKEVRKTESKIPEKQSSKESPDGKETKKPETEKVVKETAEPSQDSQDVKQAQDGDEDDDDEMVTVGPILRKPVIIATQPLPPQPSRDEVCEEALLNVKEAERRSRRLALMELTEKTCKWPIGDPATPEFWFCGLPSLPGKSYCSSHDAIAFQHVTTKRERRPFN